MEISHSPYKLHPNVKLRWTALSLRKEEEIGRLNEELTRLRRSSPTSGSGTLEVSEVSVQEGGTVQLPCSSHSRVHRKKAPLVNPFTGEDPECRLASNPEESG